MSFSNIAKSMFALTVVLSFKGVFACELGENANYRDFLEMTYSSTEYSEAEQGGWVSTIGTMINSSEHDLDSIVIEVRYFDGDSQLIDAMTEEKYWMVAPAGQEIAFRVQGLAAMEKQSYVSEVAVVTSAKLNTPCRSKAAQKKRSPWVSLLISWSPVLILIFAWYWYARKYGRSSSNRNQIDLLEDSVVATKETVTELRRIADMLEQRSDNDRP